MNGTLYAAPSPCFRLYANSNGTLINALPLFSVVTLALLNIMIMMMRRKRGNGQYPFMADLHFYIKN